MTSVWLTVPEVAERIKMSEEYVSRVCKSGKLRAVKLGRAWRIAEHDLEAFMTPSDTPPPRDRRSARQRRRSAE